MLSKKRNQLDQTPKISTFVIISEHYEPLSLPGRWLRACVIHSSYWSPVASGPTSDYQTSIQKNFSVGRTLREVNYLKKEEYMKEIPNEKLKSFSCCFLHCPSDWQVYKLSPPVPGRWLFSLEKSLPFSCIFDLLSVPIFLIQNINCFLSLPKEATRAIFLLG